MQALVGPGPDISSRAHTESPPSVSTVGSEKSRYDGDGHRAADTMRRQESRSASLLDRHNDNPEVDDIYHFEGRITAIEPTANVGQTLELVEDRFGRVAFPGNDKSGEPLVCSHLPTACKGVA
jgi:hypothetical protein